MRTLVLLRGTPASGKSTFVQEQNLHDYTLEPDKIRLMVQSPETTISGEQRITQKNDKKVWGLLFDILEDRMTRGEFTVIDATHTSTKLINKYRELVKKHRYRVVVVDFSDVPLEEALRRNSTRGLKKVPEAVIEKMHERMKGDKVSGWCKVVKPEEFQKEVVDSLKHNLSHYEKFVVFGDIHSCYEPVASYFEEFPYSENVFYIFVGDYFDRGIQPVETFRLLQTLMVHKNVMLLTGNHELHIGNFLENIDRNISKYLDSRVSWSDDEKLEYIKTALNTVKMPKPSRKTFVELLSGGVSYSEIKDFYYRLSQLAYFSFDDYTFVVTHGGIPKLPTVFDPTTDFIKGVGAYGDSETIAQTFRDNTDNNTIQIHGHRNVHNVEVFNKCNTINVTGDPEFGGKLRIVEVCDNILGSIELEDNPVYDKELGSQLVIKPNQNETLTPQGSLVEYFNKADGINVRKMDGLDVYSVNFSKKIFYSRNWEDVHIKARGLYIDSKDNVVARSYNKFFNWKEREETKTNSLRNTLQFPVSVYEKSNGFLGILSVHQDEWFFSTKATNSGEYVEMFKEAVTPYLNQELLVELDGSNKSLVFEVIHPKDLHITDYGGKVDVVLLDVISNNIEFEKYDYFILKAFAERFKFTYKKLCYTFDNFNDLYEWRKQEDALSAFEPKEEGYVLEDASGFMWKYKGTFYRFWKYMRIKKDSMVKSQDHSHIKSKLHTTEDWKVYNFMVDNYDTEKLGELSIIDVYKKFIGGLDGNAKTGS